MICNNKESCLGIDVGGANMKAAHSDGQARTSPFAVWKEPERLSEAIAELTARFPPFDRVAATMTAELCDCYATKREGVLAIIDAVSRAVPDRPTIYWGTDGRFHDADAVRSRPLIAAASNWVALASVAARLVEGRHDPDRRRRHDDRPDPPGRRSGCGSGADGHGTTPNRRTGLRGGVSNAGLRGRDRTAVPGRTDGPGRRAVRDDP